LGFAEKRGASQRYWDDDDVPKGAYADKEKLAIEVVSQAEIARGWQPSPVLGQKAQHAEGCDLFSHPPDGGVAHAIEVTHWRLVIVANLDAVMAGTGEAEVLTLTSSEVTQRAVGWRYRVPLDGLEGGIET
jgi:hypothetical protein